MPLSPTSVLAWPLERPSTGEVRSASPCEIEVVELFEELRDRVLRYLVALGLSVHDGEEIVQDSFLLLFLHLRKEKPRTNLRGWVFRVAHNLALKQRTANQLRMQRVVAFGETLPARPQADPNPEEEFGNRQRRKRLLAVVRAMPERDQSCLLLRAEGLRYREIASILGISLGSVATSVARSLQRLDRVDRS